MLKRVRAIFVWVFTSMTLSASGFEASSPGVALGEQRQDEKLAVARKFDEVEMNGTSIGDLKARLDGFFFELQREPSSRAHVIIYGGRRMPSHFRAAAIRDYLELRELQPGRLKIVSGGRRAEPALEFWIIPEGAKSPKATPPYQLKSRKKH